MRTRLRLIVDMMLGRVPGETSRPDTATRMAMDGDLSSRHDSNSSGRRYPRERDDEHLVKPADDPLAEVVLPPGANSYRQRSTRA